MAGPRLASGLPALLDEQHECDAGGDQHQARHVKRRPPAEIAGQFRADPRGQRRAHVAPNGVDAQRAAQLRGIRDDHRGADGVIDRAENAQHEQRGSQRLDTSRGRDEQAGRAVAEEVGGEQRPAAEAVRKPAHGQREQTERQECAGRKRDQLAIAAVQIGGHGDNRGRKDQEHEMIERMRPIHE